MVQGWESRAHLANKRREEARERKQMKKGPQRLSGDIIITQLLKNGLIDLENHGVEAWLENESGGKALCYSHFRAEACLKHKRCKFSHEFTIALNRGHSYDPGASETTTPRSEAHMDLYTDLLSIPSKKCKNLTLLFFDRECVYDRENPLVWQQWYELTLSRQQQDAGGLRTITEVDSIIPDDESVLSMDTDGDMESVRGRGGGLNLNLESSFSSSVAVSVVSVCPEGKGDQKEGDMKMSAAASSPLCTLPTPLFSNIMSFISDVDLCKTYVSALTIKTLILAEEDVAHRRKNYLSSVTPTSKDLSKLRKQEKKKKMKQANLKDTSKKGHKGVKVCRK